jgi:hypothetical protein
MRTLIIFLSIIFTTSLLYSQSSFVTDIGTTIDIGSGTDICADVITINGTLTGSGTFCNAPLAVEIDTLLIPHKFELSQNYPNPFNPSTRIQYQVSSISHVILKVYDVLGNEVATLVNEEKPAGSYEVEFDAAGLSSGMYFYKLQAGNPSTSSGQGFVETKKMLLLK